MLFYLLFLFASYLVVLQIFRLTTYHRYFFKTLPLLIAYSILIGYALSSITAFQGFWVTQIWASGLLFFFGYRRQTLRFRSFLEAIDDPKDRTSAQLSGASTTAYFTLSAMIYLVVYAVSFLIFVNLSAPV